MKLKSSYPFFLLLVIFVSRSLPCLSQQSVIDSLKHLIETETLNDTVRVGRLILISSNLQAVNLKSAESYGNQALEVAELINDDLSTGKALSQLGSVYAWQRKTTESLNAYYRQLEIAKKINSDYLIQNAYVGIGYVYELENEWEKALKNTLKALPFAEKTGSKYDKAFAYSCMGSQYLGLGNVILALQYLKRASELYESIGNYDQFGDAHISIAKAFAAIKQYDSAFSHFNFAISVFTRLQEPYQLADTYQQMGDVYVQRGMFREARHAYENTVANYNKNDVAEADYALAVLGLGVVAWSEKKYAEASAIFHKEFEKIQAAGIIEPQLKYLNYMAKVDSATGNFEEAFSHMQSYALLYDKYYNEERAKATQRLLVELDLQTKEKENERLKQQNELQRRYMTAFAVAGVALLLAGIFLTLLYRQKAAALSSVRELQRETEAKNDELAVINAVKDKLISMIAHDVRSPLTSLQNILYVTREKIINEAEFSKLSQVLDNDIRHLIGMLDNTLLWAREQIQALNVNKVNFNLFTLAEDVTSLYHQSLLDKDIQIHNQIPADAEVYSDKEIVHTVLRNMVSNAIKFTPRGKRIILSSEQQNGALLVSVKDEGAGISSSVLEKIKKKEFVSTRGTNKEKGTGLGLIFSYDLLSKLNEKLFINTTPGEGTIVTFSISMEEFSVS